MSARPRSSTIAALLLTAVVAELVLLPVLSAVWTSVRDLSPGASGGLTLANYDRVVSNGTLAGSLGNTLVFAGGATLLASAMGGYLAWVAERTDAPLRRAIYALAVVPVFVPGLLTTIAWSLVLHPTNGIAPVIDGRSMAGMVWAEAADGITLPFLLTAVALRSIDPALEEAAQMSGAAHRTVLRTVTIPVVRPAILGGLLVVFVKTVDSFDVPAVLGLPAGVRVLATEVFLATRGFPSDDGLAAAYAVLSLTIAFVGLYLFHRSVGSVDRFATITTRGRSSRRASLGWHRHVHGAVAAGLLAITVVVPLLVVVYTSLLPFYRPPGREVWADVSLDSYRDVLFDGAVIDRAVKNTVVAGGLAALVTVLLALLVSWVVVRGRWRWRRALDALAFAPIALPGLVIAAALMWFFLEVPLPIYATLWIVGIAWVTAHLPIALRMTHASLLQIHRDLEDASSMSGARWTTTMRRIVIPLIAPGLVVAAIYVFSQTFKGLAVPILLGGPGTEVLPVLIFDLYEGGRHAELNALGVLLLVALLGMAGVAGAMSRRWARPR